jgi:hypothetical protein
MVFGLAAGQVPSPRDFCKPSFAADSAGFLWNGLAADFAGR